MQTIILILTIFLLLVSVLLFMLLLIQSRQLRTLQRQMLELAGAARTQTGLLEGMDRNIRQNMDAASLRNEERMRTFSAESFQRLESIRQTVSQVLSDMQKEQSQQLDAMRSVVDEKMQKVLEERMQQAFSAVNERLEQVHRGLGEMQGLAAGVGDLKKLLTNVKTRGEIGEIRLDALLQDIFAENQFFRNARTGRGVVEFALRLPDAAGGERLLPVDAKFAGDTYRHLQDAYETGDKKEIEKRQKLLWAAIEKESQDIAQKYIDPPSTTDYAVLFLPTEGLYTEAVRGGLLERMFQKYRIFIAGPSTAAALFTSLQMGMQSAAVERSSKEVWRLLGEVRTEFCKFAEALARTQDKLHSASDELEKLVGVRTRQMERRLSTVSHYLTEQSSGEENRS